MQAKTRCRSVAAFTLIELVMASGIIAILLVVVQSIIILAAHAVPGVQSRSTTLTSAAGVLADFDSDIAFATAGDARPATNEGGSKIAIVNKISDVRQAEPKSEHQCSARLAVAFSG